MVPIDDDRIRHIDEFILTHISTHGTTRLARGPGDELIFSFFHDNILDEFSIASLRKELSDAIDGIPSPKVIVNYEAIDHLSSAALGEIIRASNSTKNRGGRFIQCNMNFNIYDVLVITKLNKLWAVADCVEDAIGYINVPIVAARGRPLPRIDGRSKDVEVAIIVENAPIQAVQDLRFKTSTSRDYFGLVERLESSPLITSGDSVTHKFVVRARYFARMMLGYIPCEIFEDLDLFVRRNPSSRIHISVNGGFQVIVDCNVIVSDSNYTLKQKIMRLDNMF